MSAIALALTFFFVTNPIGMSPTIVAMVKDYPFEKQKKIVLREGIFSFLIALFFLYAGEYFLKILNAKDYALSLTGGIVLFITSVQMLFPKKAIDPQTIQLKREPFIVPIATPLLSGPGLMTTIMIYSRMENNNFKIFFAITLTWIGVITVLAIAPYLQKLIGKRGLEALEQVMGLVLGLISIEMFINGGKLFVKSLAI